MIQTLEWIARPDVLLRRCARRFGEPFTLRTAWSDAPVVVVWRPDAVRAVYAAPPEAALAGAASALLRPLVGPRSVLVLDGDAHLRARRRLLPALHGARMRALRPLVARVAEREVATWDGPLRVLPRARSLTLDVIVQAAFGAPDPELRAALRRALDTAASVPRLAAMTLVRRDVGSRSPYGAFLRAVARADAVLLDRIAAHRRAPRGGIAGDLLAAGADDATLRDELMTVLVAGHETTATALAWVLERLARRPDVLRRIRGDGDPVLDAVVQETLRVRPVLSLTPRRLAAPLEVAGHELPAGVDVAPSIWLAHREPGPGGFADPDAFRPERWLAGRPPAGTFMPWGGGVRRCAGAAFATMELREVLRVVAARVDLAPAGPWRPEAVRRHSVTLAPARGGALRATPRR